MCAPELHFLQKLKFCKMPGKLGLRSGRLAAHPHRWRRASKLQRKLWQNVADIQGVLSSSLTILMICSTTHGMCKGSVLEAWLLISDQPSCTRGGRFEAYAWWRKFSCRSHWRLLHSLLSGCSSSISVTLTLTGASAPSQKLISQRVSSLRSGLGIVLLTPSNECWLDGWCQVWCKLVPALCATRATWCGISGGSTQALNAKLEDSENSKWVPEQARCKVGG